METISSKYLYLQDNMVIIGHPGHPYYIKLAPRFFISQFEIPNAFNRWMMNKLFGWEWYTNDDAVLRTASEFGSGSEGKQDE